MSCEQIDLIVLDIVVHFLNVYWEPIKSEFSIRCNSVLVTALEFTYVLTFYSS